MPVIRRLDDSIVSKIAAGEVVERPMSAVKELVENALDAGARNVLVEMEEGGQKLVRVSDDGCGMSAEDALLAPAAHATSKISGLDDLQNIRTMGFRGEALWSIASVSRMTLISRRECDEIGTRVWIGDDGSIQSRPAAREAGTTVEVLGLFHNTPARKKFQKSARSEMQAVRKLMDQFALSHPAVGFVLKQGDAVVLRTEPDEDPLRRLRYVFGKDLQRGAIEIEAEFRRLRLHGFIMKPEMGFPNRNHQFFFVNGRIVRDQTLSVAVDTAYKGLIHHGRHPFAVLHLELPPDELDVNVHPTKKEVRFANRHEVHSLIYRAIRDEFISRAGQDGGRELKLVSQSRAEEAPHAEQRGLGFTYENPWRGATFPLTNPRDPAPARPDVPAPGGAPPAAGEAEPVRADPLRRDGAEGPSPYAPPIASLKILGQYYRTYILIEVDGRPMFVDQHVAHERILYNKLKAQDGRPATQMLLIEEPVEVPHYAYPTLAENLDLVKRIGVEIEPFGERAFIIRSILHNAGGVDPAALLIGLANEISSAGFKTPENVLLDKLLTTASCKMAVKAGSELSFPEMRELVHDLFQEAYYHTCPHGRPILYEITETMLNRTFKRTGF